MAIDCSQGLVDWLSLIPGRLFFVLIDFVDLLSGA